MIRLTTSSRAVLSCLVLASLCPVIASAQGLGTTNQSTLARNFALPVVGQTSPVSQGRWTGSIDLTSEFVDKEEGSEAIELDGETARFGLRFEQALGDRADWNIEVPLLHTGGGFMDGPIEGWHDVFALPQGGREESARDRYRYRYQRDGETLLDAESGGTNLGDVQVGAGMRVFGATMLRGMIKLPTGDEDELAGGNLGAALWADVPFPFEVGSRLGGFASAGLSVNDKSDVLEHQQNTVIPFGAVGFDVRLLPSLQALVQLYAHGPLYDDAEVNALESAGLQLSIGGRWCAEGKAPCAELSFQEDPIVASSPDFSLRFALVLPAF